MENLTSGKNMEIIYNCVSTTETFWDIDNIDMLKSKWMD